MSQQMQQTLDSTDWLWQHRPLTATKMREASLPVAPQYILSSATAIKFLRSQFLSTSARYFAIGKRTAQWAIEMIPAIEPLLEYPRTTSSFSLLNLVKHLPVKPTIWLGSAQGFLRHTPLWHQNSWITPFITHWVWPDFSGAKKMCWAEPAEITCHCQAAAIVLQQIDLHPCSTIWLSSERLKHFFKPSINIKIFEHDWFDEILEQQRELLYYLKNDNQITQL
jgi:hypothetical protein